MLSVYDLAKQFKKKYPGTIAWRLRANSKVIEKHLNDNEKVLYVFAGQKEVFMPKVVSSPISLFSTAVVALTDKRILIGRKRVAFGYFLDVITPDMFNDLKVKSNLIWGKVLIDTVKELVVIKNIANSALEEIETKIIEYMMKEKKRNHNCDTNSHGIKE